MPYQVKKILRFHQIRPKHSKGQNFLLDEGIVHKILELADLSSNDLVVEIGSGLGALTIPLCHKVERVIAIEWDRDLVEILKYMTSNIDNLDIVQADALSFDYDNIYPNSLMSITVLGNLPYYIATALTQRLLPKANKIKKLVFMVQKEVGERLVAQMGQKAYGALSLITEYYSVAEKLLDVSKNAFYPKPKIDSSIIKMTLRKKRAIKITNENLFFSIIKAGFSHRRKTLFNALSRSLHLDITPVGLKQILKKADISSTTRAEELSLVEFANLAELLNSRP